MKITMQKIETLLPYERNPKAHPPEQVQKIAASITEYGFLVPLVIDNESVIIAGHGRYEAAKLLGLKEIPTVKIGNLTPNQIKAYRIADNRVAESDWLDEALQEELRELHAAGYNLDLTGFSLEEITGPDDELEKKILSEQEPQQQDETSIADITRQITDRMQEIAAADPQRLEKAKAIILPLKKGSRSCFILADPNTSDAIRELQRYHAAGEASPLDCLFRSIFSMKSTTPEADQ